MIIAVAVRFATEVRINIGKDVAIAKGPSVDK